MQFNVIPTRQLEDSDTGCKALRQRTVFQRVASAVGCVLVATALAPSAQAQEYQADVDVLHDSEFHQKFDIDPIYLGQTLTLRASGGPVEINTRSVQKKRCKVRVFACFSWHYYTVTNPNPKSAEDYPILVQLFQGNDPLGDHVKVGSQERKLQYTLQEADGTIKRFTSPARVKAKLPDTLDDGEPVTRQDCSTAGQPGSVCSRGTFQLHLAIDASERLTTYLPQYLKEMEPSPSEILSDRVLDPNTMIFLTTESGRTYAKDVAKELVSFAKNNLNDENQLDDFVAILHKAKQIDPDAFAIERELGIKYVQVGAYDEAKQILITSLKGAESSISQLTDWTDFRDMAVARFQLAVAFTEDFAGIVGAELLKADQSYELGIQHMNEAIRRATQQADRNRLAGKLARMKLARAQHLMRIRTVPALQVAEALLAELNQNLGLYIPGQPIDIMGANRHLLVGDPIENLLFDVPESSQINVQSIPYAIRNPLHFWKPNPEAHSTFLAIDQHGDIVAVKADDGTRKVYEVTDGEHVTDGMLASQKAIVLTHKQGDSGTSAKGILIQLDRSDRKNKITVDGAPDEEVKKLWRPIDPAPNGEELASIEEGGLVVTNWPVGDEEPMRTTVCELPNEVLMPLQVVYGTGKHYLVTFWEKATKTIQFHLIHSPKNDGRDAKCPHRPLPPPGDRTWLAGGEFSPKGDSLALISDKGLVSIIDADNVDNGNGDYHENDKNRPLLRQQALPRFLWQSEDRFLFWFPPYSNYLYTAKLDQDGSEHVASSRRFRIRHAYSKARFLLASVPGLNKPIAYVTDTHVTAAIVDAKRHDLPSDSFTLPDSISTRTRLLNGKVYIENLVGSGVYRIVDTEQTKSTVSNSVPNDLADGTSNGKLIFAVNCCQGPRDVHVIGAANGNGFYSIGRWNKTIRVRAYWLDSVSGEPTVTRTCFYSDGMEKGHWESWSAGDVLARFRKSEKPILKDIWATRASGTITHDLLYREWNSAAEVVVLRDPKGSECGKILHIDRPIGAYPLLIEPESETVVWQTPAEIIVQPFRATNANGLALPIDSKAETITTQLMWNSPNLIIGWVETPADDGSSVGKLVQVALKPDGGYEQVKCGICREFTTSMAIDRLTLPPAAGRPVSGFRMFSVRPQDNTLAVTGSKDGSPAIVFGSLIDKSKELQYVKGVAPVVLGDSRIIIRVDDGRLVSREIGQ